MYLPAWFHLVSPHLAFLPGVFESKFQISVISPTNTSVVMEQVIFKVSSNSDLGCVCVCVMVSISLKG